MQQFYGYNPYLQLGYPDTFYREMTPGYGFPGQFEQWDNDEEHDSDNRDDQDINRVMRLINRRYNYLYTEITRGGMDRKLAEYLFRSIVYYVDRNFNDFSGNINNRVNQAERQLRRRHPWIFDIMDLYSVSPASQSRVVESVLTIAFENLRRPPRPPFPGGPGGPGGPGPNPRY